MVGYVGASVSQVMQHSWLTKSAARTFNAEAPIVHIVATATRSKRASSWRAMFHVKHSPTVTNYANVSRETLCPWRWQRGRPGEEIASVFGPRLDQ
jgi:hypothetical protein